jgi:hypothetical protein
MSPPFTEANKVGLLRVLKQINLLNGILIIGSIVFIFGFLFPRLDTEVTFMAPPISKKPVEKNPYDSLKTQTLSPQEYRVTADQNLFHPDRIIPPEKTPESVLPKPEFVLFGTLITPDLRMAYMEDKKAPVTTPGRGQRQSALKIGESLSGFRLKEIMPDKVVMTRGEETLQVPLQEPGSSKARDITTTPGPGPRTPVPVPAGSIPSTPPPSPSYPPPERTPPLPPGQRIQRPVPPGRMPAFPSPGVQPGETIPVPPNMQ